MMVRRPRGLAVTGLLLAGLVLSGCAAERDPVPTPSIDDTVDPLDQPRFEPGEVPDFVEGGTADENLDYFVFRLEALLAQEPRPSSRQLVDALSDAGFDTAAMQVTADTTPLGSRTDSILVSVRLEEECLVGQVFEGRAVSDVADVLGTGACLVGRTLSIDW